MTLVWKLVHWAFTIFHCQPTIMELISKVFGLLSILISNSKNTLIGAVRSSAFWLWTEHNRIHFLSVFLFIWSCSFKHIFGLCNILVRAPVTRNEVAHQLVFCLYWLHIHWHYKPLGEKVFIGGKLCKRVGCIEQLDSSPIRKLYLMYPSFQPAVPIAISKKLCYYRTSCWSFLIGKLYYFEYLPAQNGVRLYGLRFSWAQSFAMEKPNAIVKTVLYVVWCFVRFHLRLHPLRYNHNQYLCSVVPF